MSEEYGDHNFKSLRFLRRKFKKSFSHREPWLGTPGEKESHVFGGSGGLGMTERVFYMSVRLLWRYLREDI